MIITHSKVQTLQPVWADFSGYSLIFENLSDPGRQPRAATFADDGESLAFFAAAAAALRSIGEETLMRKLLLCLLPQHSYHVTAIDLINAGNRKKVALRASRKAAKAVAKAAGDPQAPPQLLAKLGLTGGVNGQFPLRFRSGGLEALNQRALVIRLEPAGAADERMLARMLDWRCSVQHRLEEKTGLAPSPYQAHMTLGYFASRGLADQAPELLEDLAAALNRALAGRELPVAAAALYSFTSMERFHRIPG